MVTEDDVSGVFVLRQDLEPMEKRHMEQDYSKHSKERSPSGRTTVSWSKQMEEGTV